MLLNVYRYVGHNATSTPSLRKMQYSIVCTSEEHNIDMQDHDSVKNNP